MPASEHVAEAPAADPGGSEPSELRLLRARLEDETRRREALERELAAVRSAAASPAPGASGASGGAGSSAGAAGDGIPKPDARDGWIDESVLKAAGFTPSELEVLRERFEAIELQRLFIRDRAQREGWYRKPRYYQRMRALNAEYESLRDDYGDERYDWILYSSGRSNRVVIQRVMGGSPAAETGLEPGDVVLRYDDERIFDAESLQSATSAGEFGETVALDVERDGERIRLYPPRGPLGVGLGVASREPERLY